MINNDVYRVADQRFSFKQCFARVLSLTGSEKLVLPIVIFKRISVPSRVLHDVTADTRQ